MDPGGILLLLVVVGCVIALFYISKKQKELDAPDIETKREVEAEEKKVPEHHSESVVSTQDTIYEFQPDGTLRICPYCDGENQKCAEECVICGQKLS